FYYIHLMIRRRPNTTLFPYTTLFRSEITHFRRIGDQGVKSLAGSCGQIIDCLTGKAPPVEERLEETLEPGDAPVGKGGSPMRRPDRKSTRLNSSHGSISYAVFCLKKK